MEIYLFKTLGGICLKNMLVSINMIFKFKASPSVSVFVSVCVPSHIVLFCLLWGGEQWIPRDIYLSVIRFLKWHSTRDIGLALIMNHNELHMQMYWVNLDA